MTLAEAKNDCSASFKGHLITNEEWLAIARNIETHPKNWSGGQVGSGVLPRGNSNSQAAATVFFTETTGFNSREDRPYHGTGFERWENKRTFELSTGGKIWDFAGNLWQWVDFNEDEMILPGDVPSNLQGFFNVLLVNWRLPKYGPFYRNGSAQNYGEILVPKARTLGVIRGGAYSNGSTAGIYSYYGVSTEDYKQNDLSYRCTQSFPKEW